jgi:hypothetical protein
MLTQAMQAYIVYETTTRPRRLSLARTGGGGAWSLRMCSATIAASRVRSAGLASSTGVKAASRAAGIAPDSTFCARGQRGGETGVEITLHAITRCTSKH